MAEVEVEVEVEVELIAGGSGAMTV